MMRRIFLLMALCLAGICAKAHDPMPQWTKDYFPSWNSCEALTALQEYVADVTNPSSEHFIPVEDRLPRAVF